MLPASDVGRVLSPIDGESTGIFIIMDLVTLGSSICSSGMKPKFNNSYKKTQENGEKIKKNQQLVVPLPEIEWIEKDAGLWSFFWDRCLAANQWRCHPKASSVTRMTRLECEAARVKDLYIYHPFLLNICLLLLLLFWNSIC